MAPAGDPSITETPEYRIVVLFATFIAITYAFEHFMHWLNVYLKKIGRRGLLHTIHKLEEELLALGLISLILIAIEEFIVEICINSDGDDKKKSKTDKKKDGSSKKKDEGVADAADPDGEAAAVLSSEVDAVDPDDPDDPSSAGFEEDEAVPTGASLMDDLDLGSEGSRRLLGGVMRTLLAGGGGGDVCPDGQESFWSIRTLHETHIFIFLLASVHITFAGFSMLLCSWKVRQWKQWEQRRNDLLKRIDYDNLLNKNQPAIHYIRAFFSQFHQQVDETVYLSLRRLFIERMELDNDFEFHKFLVNFMEEEFSKVIKLEWTMWAVAAIWIITNPAVVYIMEGLGVVLSLIAGTKLTSIALKLGNEAWILYADKPPPGAGKRAGNAFTKTLKRVSTGVAQKVFGYNPNSSEQGKKGDAGNGGNGGNGGNVGSGASRFFYPPNAEAQGKGTGRRDSGESGQGHDSVFSFNQNAAEISNGDPTSMESVGGQVVRRQDIGGYDLLTSRSVDVDGAKPTKPGTAGFGMAPVLKHENDTVDREESFPPLCSGLCCWPGDNTEDLKKMRKNTFSNMYHAHDSASLFPFRRPRLMLLIFQFTYFETSLMAAVLLFNIWQEVDPDLILSREWPAFVELGVGIAVMLLTSILLLPVYWLTMVVGSHCPSKVLQKAKKRKVNPRTLSAFERVSVSLKKKSIAMARTSMSRVSASAQKMSGTENDASNDGNSIPTHWAELESVPDAEAARIARTVETKPQSPAAEVEEEDHGAGALGMLVGAMLKNKKRELEGVTGGGAGKNETVAPSLERVSSSGNSSLSGKLKPLLARISVPLINLPKSSSQPDLMRMDDPQAPAAVVGAPQEHRPLPGLHDIVETTNPTGSRMLKKSKSYQDINRDDLTPEELEPDGEQSPGPAQLSRGSMPIMRLIEQKQKAYLERERQVAEHLMQEHPDEDLHHDSPVHKATGSDMVQRHTAPNPSRKLGAGPEDSMVARHRALRAREGPSRYAGKSEEVNNEYSPSHSVAWQKPALLHPSLDHVAELFKYGEKQKHQRE